MKQISAFIENSKGSLSYITGLFKESGIDIKAMTLADTAEYGILRMIVSDSKKALDTLKSNGVIASITNVTVVAIENQIGGLGAVLTLLDKENLNIEYMYAFEALTKSGAFAVFRFEDGDRAREVLKANGIDHVSEEDLR